MKTKLKFFIITLLFCCMHKLDAQNITLYYDDNWKGTEDAEFATYKAVYAVPSDSLLEKRFIIRRVFDNSVYQDGSYYSYNKYDAKKQILKEYKIYDKKGNVLEKMSGDSSAYIITSYFDNGKEKSIAPYKHGKLDGAFYSFLENDNVIAITPMKNGESEGWYDLYYNGVRSRYKEKDNTQIFEPISERDCNIIHADDGKSWLQYIKNGFIIQARLEHDKDYGNYWALKLTFSNYTRYQFPFTPELIKGYAIHNHKEELIPSYEAHEYINLVKKKQNRRIFWAGFTSSFVNALAAQNYATTRISTDNFSAKVTTQYFDSYSYRSSMAESDKQIREYNRALLGEREALRNNYLSRYILKPGESLTGFICFPYKEAEMVYIYLNILGQSYLYKFNANLWK